MDILTQRLVRKHTLQELETASDTVQSALTSGASSMSLPGISGTIDRDGMMQWLERYEMAIRSKIADTSDDQAQALAPAPLAHNVQIHTRLVPW